jgi:hypothetical protein
LLKRWSYELWFHQLCKILAADYLFTNSYSVPIVNKADIALKAVEVDLCIVYLSGK